MAVISVFSAKDNFNAARMIARTACPASAFAAVAFAKRHFFHLTAIDHAGISVKTPVIAGVAQLVEHPICNRAVGSSSLSASTTPLHENVDFPVLL